MEASNKQKCCSICGKPFDKNVEGLSGNPVLSHWECIFEALAESREKAKHFRPQEKKPK